MICFVLKKKGITTATEDKHPKALWQITYWKIDADELERNLFVSPEDGFHVRIGSNTYFEILFDNNEFVELDKNLTSKILLRFVDTKNADRLKMSWRKPNLKTYSKGKQSFAGFCLYWWINGSCW
jgi:acetyl-CoA carboxylase carboxyl transferase subunit beta